MKKRDYSKDRKPFIAFTAIEAKSHLQNMGIAKMKEQATVLGCSKSYWSMLCVNAPSEIISDRMCVRLFCALNARHKFVTGQPRKLIVSLIEKHYSLSGGDVFNLMNGNINSDGRLALIGSHYKNLLNINDILEPLSKEQLNAIRELAGLSVSEAISVFGFGVPNEFAKHSNLAKYFYGKKPLLLCPDKSARFWLGLFVYFDVINPNRLQNRVIRLLKND